MPKLKELLEHPPSARGGAEAQIAEMRNYLYRIVEELQYLLTHLESDNVNSTLWDDIDSQIPKAGTATPLMDGVGSAGSSPRWSRENHRHPADTSKADVTALAQAKADLEDAIEAEADAREDHEADTGNPHEVTKAQVGLGNVENERQYSAQNPPPIPTPAEVGAIPATDKGSAGGVAELDANGMVPSSQLPSYVDDVLEYASLSAFPVTGEGGKIYVALDTNRTYRWSGSAYVEISESLALGETASTAYRGDRGKTAYDHSQLASGNPHNVSASDVGLGNVANERQYSALNPPPLPTPADIGAATAQDLTDHEGDTNNPHSVTAAQVGARPDTWTPTASDVGARPDDWVPDADDVPYDNTQSGLMATDVQGAIDELAQGGGGGSAASAVSYDNTGSGLAATNVQDAIDEVYGDIPAQASDIGAQEEILVSGILKGDGAGVVSAAVAGTDYGTYSKPSGGIPASDLASGVIPTVPSASTANPAMDGTAAPGSSGAWARGDHVHPSDISRVPNYGKGVNLLRNWYFVGGGSGRGVFPINQRGFTSSAGTNQIYWFDGWYINNGSGIQELLSNGLHLNHGTGSGQTTVQQAIDNTDLTGKTVTFSVLANGTLVSASAVWPTQTSSAQLVITLTVTSALTVRLRCLASGSGFGQVQFWATGDAPTVQAIKLELGTQQTLCHNEGTDANPVWVLNTIPDYEEELIKSQTSTADSTDTYANKSLATEQQLAYVETGTTASRAYAVGEFFCWDGLLYRVTAAISSGGDINPGANCTPTTVGSELSTNHPVKSYYNVLATGVASIKLPAITYVGLLTIKRGASSGLYAMNSVRLNYLAGDLSGCTTDGAAAGQTITFNDSGVHTIMLMYY